MTLKNNRAPLLSNIKLYASFHHHMWIQTGVTVRKRLSWVVTSVTLTFDLWPWPFAWTLRWSLVITPENFKMIRWWEHSQKGVTDRRIDGQTDRQTENTICRAAWSQLKTDLTLFYIHWNHYLPVNGSNDSNSITEWDEILLFVYVLFLFIHLRAGTQPNEQISPNFASVRRQGEPCSASDDKVGIMITLDLQCRADII